MSVGIDIGSKTVKIVELIPAGNVWRLNGSGVIGYQGVTPDQAKDERDITNIAQVIKKLHAEARISSKNVSIALPEPLVFTRTIKFPPLTDQEISSAVKWEAEQYIPIPIADAIVQHQVIERRLDTTPPEVIVLLVAAPRKLVETYVKAVQLAGLNVVGVETELMSLTRGLAPVNQTVLLVDFGAKSTDIAIAKNGQLTFSRSIPTAGEAFTRAVAQTLGVELQQAEEYKRTYGMEGSQLEGKIKGALDPVFNIVIDEIKKAIHFYQTEERGDTPKTIVLSGGTAGMPQALPLISKALGIEVIIGNPFARISVDPQAMKTIAPYSPLYSIAVGLALRGV